MDNFKLTVRRRNYLSSRPFVLLLVLLFSACSKTKEQANKKAEEEANVAVAYTNNLIQSVDKAREATAKAQGAVGETEKAYQDINK